MRNPNGYGSIRKLTGKRKKPFGVYITTGYDMTPAAPSIDFLQDILTADLYDQVKTQYETYRNTLIPSARQIQKCIGYYATRSEAMIALAEYNKNPYDINEKDITFGQVYDLFVDREFSKMGSSAKTVYTTSFKKCDSIKDMRMRDIRLAHLQRIIDSYSDKSKSTQNNIIVLLHAIFQLCMQNDICDKDYSQYLKITSTAEKKTKKPFSKKEVALIWDNLDWLQPLSPKNVLYNIRLMDSIIILLYTGMRINELLSLKKSDVHLDDRWIDLNGTKTAAAKRIVPIHSKIIPLLQDRLNTSEGDYLFCDNKNNRITYSRYKTSFYIYFTNHFKIERTPHECRHTFVTVATACGMNKILLKKIIGHSSTDITERVYTHAYVADLIQEIDKYDL